MQRGTCRAPLFQRRQARAGESQRVQCSDVLGASGANPVRHVPACTAFVWDLTYPAPDVLAHDYPISAIYHDTPLYPLGAAVLPGTVQP